MFPPFFPSRGGMIELTISAPLESRKAKNGSPSAGPRRCISSAAAGRVEELTVFGFLHREAGNHEMPRYNQQDLCGLDEPIEFLAPTSPGRVKIREDRATVLCLCSGGFEDGVGRRRRICRKQRANGYQRNDCKPHVHLARLHNTAAAWWS